MPVTDDGKEVIKVPCIHYLVEFQECQEQIRTLLNNGSEVNVMSLAYVEKLGIKIRKINVGVEKNDSSTLKAFGIVIADFQVEDKDSKPKFFQKTFFVANTKFEVILKMLFVKLSNADMSFNKRTLT